MGGYGCEGDFDSVEIEEIGKECPQTVLEAFERHIWFSQHILNHIFAFVIPVAGSDTYAIGVSGMTGDGYDNSGHFIEVFDESGQLVGASRLIEGEKPLWLDRTIEGKDFDLPAPEWSDSSTTSPDPYVGWSEETAIRTQQDGKITHLIMFVPE